MNREERYEVNVKGELVVGEPTTLSQNEKKEIIKNLFNRNGWNYEVISEETTAHFKIKLSNTNLQEEHIIHLYHGNVRKEDPDRNREEKKYNLGL